MKQQTILLISANRFDKPYPVYPIGLSYISSYLKEKLPHYKVVVYDLYLNGYDELQSIIHLHRPKYIGVSLRNVDDANSLSRGSFFGRYKELIDILRGLCDAKIIVGGAGFSIFPERFYNLLRPDFGIYGEGEKSFLELINCMDFGTDASNIEGLVYIKNGKVLVNKRQHHCQDLTLNFENNLIDYYWQHSGMLNVQTKRGCPYKCIYCSYPVIEGPRIRTLNTDEIVNTLKDLYFNKGINYVFFTDSVFNIENEYNHELADKIISSGIRIKWGAYFTVKNLNEKLLIKLKQSGLTHVEFGTESLSDLTLKKYGKSFRVRDVIEKSELCRKHGIHFAHFMILAGYGETDETINETYQNSKKIGPTVFFPFVGMRIYPGTKLHELAIKDGTIDRNDDLLEPRYYLSKNVDLLSLQPRAAATGRSWIFPDIDVSEKTKRLKAKNLKGPLWEHLLS